MADEGFTPSPVFVVLFSARCIVKTYFIAESLAAMGSVYTYFLVYRIDPGGYPSSQISENMALPAGFSEFKFIIAPDGATRWMRDGIQKLASYPDGPMVTADIQIQLRLYGVGASVDPDQTSAHFDNVTVTRP